VRCSFRFALASAALFSFLPSLPSQFAIGQSIQQAAAAAAQSPAPLADRRKALNDLFSQYWDTFLAHSPEFASEIGDTRFNDKLFDYSPQAANEWIEHEQEYLMRLAAIDPTGFTPDEAKAREELLTQFTNDIADADARDWEVPVSASGGVYAAYADLADDLSFNNEQDYENWTTRLRALPGVIDQLIANMGTGIENHRVPAKSVLEKELAVIQQQAAQKPADSPFADPLKQFPAPIPALQQQAIQQEMLDVIAKRVLPAYQRLARFFQVSYIPAADSAHPDQPTGKPASSGETSQITWQGRQARILTLLGNAQQTLGDKFNATAFHDKLVNSGAVTLDELTQQMNAWVASQK
jgi:uncharacterized protein (DUF885 family)